MSDTTLISLRIPNDLLKVVDDEAKSALRSRAQMIVWRLRRGYGDTTGRIDGVDGETATGSEGGRGTEGYAVPDVRKTSKPEKRLHPVHALRNELVSGGGQDKGSEVEQRAIPVVENKPRWCPVSQCEHGFANSFLCRRKGGGC